MAKRSTQPSVLTIAGSDSGGGAGIQADLKTFAARSLHGLSVVTAVTAQNTRSVVDVLPMPAALVRAQIEAVFDDFDVRAVKIGMLGNIANILAVAESLVRFRARCVVLDPVMIASSGARLFPEKALAALRETLLPLVTLITPNVPEAEILLGRSISDAADMRGAAEALQRSGKASVLLKGGHLSGPRVLDVLVTTQGIKQFSFARQPIRAHGTGCTLSAAIAAELALGHPLAEAVARAERYLHRTLARAYRPGKGAVHVLQHRL